MWIIVTLITLGLVLGLRLLARNDLGRELTRDEQSIALENQRNMAGHSRDLTNTPGL